MNSLVKPKIKVSDRVFSSLEEAYVYKILKKYNYKIKVNEKILVIEQFNYLLEKVNATRIKVNFVLYDYKNQPVAYIFVKTKKSPNLTSKQKLLITFLKYKYQKLNHFPLFLVVYDKTTAQIMEDKIRN